MNPDCGLKTRRGEEVAAALSHMVAAAHRARPGAAVPAGPHRGRERVPAVNA